MKIFRLVICLSFLILSNIYSQDDSIISVDQTKITLSTDIVPQWKVQAEIGGSSWYSEDSRTFFQGTEEYFVRDFQLRMDIPSLAFRIGVYKNIEVRFAAVFKQDFHTVESNSLFVISDKRGVYAGGPLEAGVKMKLFKENKILPSVAVKADIFIPAGDFYFHMDYVSPVFRLMLEKDLSKKFSIGANAAYGWNVYDYFTDKYGEFAFSLNASLSNKLAAFAEVFSYFQHKRTPDHRVDAGLKYRFARNVMAVVQGGFGISERAPDIFGSGGIGFLFP